MQLDPSLKAAIETCRCVANDMIAENIQWRLDPRYILKLCSALDALTAASAGQVVGRPESVQAAFEVFEGKPETGPHATAMFQYILRLEAALQAAPAEPPDAVRVEGGVWMDGGKEFVPEAAETGSTTRRLMTEFGPVDVVMSNDAALQASPPEPVAGELDRYIVRCKELANGGEYSWWSRLAEILTAFQTSPVASPPVTDEMVKWAAAAIHFCADDASAEDLARAALSAALKGGE